MPDFNVPFKVYTDASMEAVGAVLAQDREGLERVVVYASQSLTPTERRWSTFDRELWAIVWAVRQFRHYIGVAAFTIITDHKPLLGLRTMSIDKDPTGRRARWILELDPFNWVIQHKNGKQHTNADALSRRPQDPLAGTVNDASREVATQVTAVGLDRESGVPQADSLLTPSSAANLPTSDLITGGQPLEPDSEISDLSFIHALSHDGTGLKELQQADPDIATVFDWRDSRPPRGQMRGSSRWLRKLWTEHPRLSVVNNLLCRGVTSSLTGGAQYQVVVPSSLVPDVLHHLHGGPVSAHFSAERVWEQARQTCYWPSMFKDIRQWCGQCLPCHTRRAPVPKYRAPMGGSQATRPFQRVAMDNVVL
ncbi:hypothetical protein VZT92_026730 [Zoarces viviparus]